MFIFFFFLCVSPAFSEDFIQPKKETLPPRGAIGLCEKYSWACESIEGLQAEEAIVKRVNREINKTTSINDIDQYGVHEYWSTLSFKGGDCEDYSLSKMKKLIDLGVDSNSLFIAVVLDKQKTLHAVLIWRTESGDFVLDNLTSKIKHWKKTGYFFISMQNPNDKTKWSLLLNK